MKGPNEVRALDADRRLIFSFPSWWFNSRCLSRRCEPGHQPGAFVRDGCSSSASLAGFGGLVSAALANRQLGGHSCDPECGTKPAQDQVKK